MKILLVNTVPTDKNGITNVLFNYLRAMDTKGMQIDLVSLNQPDDAYIKEVEKKGGRIYVLPRLQGTMTYWKSLRNLMRENNYDAIHIHGNSHTTVLELTAAKAAGCVVRMVHAHNTTCKQVVVHKLLTPIFNTLCTDGLACGKAAGEFMFGKKTFTVMNNGVDTEKFAFKKEPRETIRKKHSWEGCKIIGHVGYFSEVKNHQWIIEVFRELQKIDNTYRLLLIGEGNLKDMIVEKAKSYDILDKITFTGNINNVDEYLNAMDLIMMPSLYEGLPLTLIEQQANGLRCVVSDTITKEVDKTNNMKFLPLTVSAEQWADEILSICVDDNQVRSERSLKAIEDITFCNYSIKEEAEKLRNYYYKNK